MANWASTSYVIEGPEETLKKIDEAVKQSISNPPENASEGWEGSILMTLGANKEDLDKFYVRGFVEESTINSPNEMQLYAEEAWGITDFYKILGKLLPDIKIYWIVESIEDEVFATNDKEGKYFNSMYIADAYIGNADYYEYFETEESLYSWISKLTNGKVNTPEKVEKFNNRAEDKGLDDYIHIFKIEIVD